MQENYHTVHSPVLGGYKLSTEKEYGFRKKTCTVNHISYVTHICHKYFQLQSEPQVIALDITKSFHKVLHTALQKKPLLPLHFI